MKMLKKITAYVLAIASILSLTACGGGGGTDVTKAENTTTTIDDEIDNPVNISDITLEGVTEKEVDIKGVELTYLGCYDPMTAGDTKPAYKYFTETYGATVTVKMVNDLVIMDNLSTLISSGQSPDIVDRRENTFPYYISKNTYEPLDEYFDFTAPQWEGLTEIIDSLAIKGKHYLIPWTYQVSPNFLIYNRGLFLEYGIDDPNELWEKGEWTWDTFKSCMTEFMDASTAEDAIGIYGKMDTSFINSTGSTFIGFENGKLVNNTRTTEVERAQLFLEELRKNKISAYSLNGENDVSEKPLLEGRAAFHCCGDWIITNYAKKAAKENGYTSENPVIEQDREKMALDIFFVPLPRDPQADKYYYQLKPFGYLVPSGSKNAEAVVILINCIRLSKTDETLYATTQESILRNKKYTQEQYEKWTYFQTVSNFKAEDLVMDNAGAFTSTTYSEVVLPMLADIIYDQDEEQKSWTQMREENYNILQTELDEMNALLAS